MEHQVWDALLRSMSAGGPRYGPGGSQAMLAKVLSRAALAREPVPRSEISKGSMLIRPKPLASGTVGKAVDALVGEGLLDAENSKKSGQPGPPITPLRLSDKWAIIGIHIDQQHEGPDGLTGIICGLDRKALCDPVEVDVPKKGDQHDLRGLAEDICKLTRRLLTQVDGPRKFLGVGVEIGGHVHHGVVQDSVHARWSQAIDLQKVLTEELGKVPELRGVPAVVENDVNALAIHGFYERSFEGLDVTLVTVFRQGVGGALILNGRMYRGFGGMAPEPGHIAVEYPEDQPMWSPPPTPGAAASWTFGDECLCSTRDRKSYGHLDTLAVPARIEGQLAAIRPDEKVSLEEAAAAAKIIRGGDGAQVLMLSPEAVVLRRAGRALGRGLTDLINALNPGHLVLRLPQALAAPAPQSSGTEYLDAVEREVDGAYSTGPADARRRHLRLTVHGYADDEAAYAGAVAAAATVFHAFIEHARGRDGCPPATDGDRRAAAPPPAAQPRVAEGRRVKERAG